MSKKKQKKMTYSDYKLKTKKTQTYKDYKENRTTKKDSRPAETQPRTTWTAPESTGTTTGAQQTVGMPGIDSWDSWAARNAVGAGMNWMQRPVTTTVTPPAGTAPTAPTPTPAPERPRYDAAAIDARRKDAIAENAKINYGYRMRDRYETRPRIDAAATEADRKDKLAENAKLRYNAAVRSRRPQEYSYIDAAATEAGRKDAIAENAKINYGIRMRDRYSRNGQQKFSDFLKDRMEQGDKPDSWSYDADPVKGAIIEDTKLRYNQQVRAREYQKLQEKKKSPLDWYNEMERNQQSSMLNWQGESDAMRDIYSIERAQEWINNNPYDQGKLQAERDAWEQKQQEAGERKTAAQQEMWRRGQPTEEDKAEARDKIVEMEETLGKFDQLDREGLKTTYYDGEQYIDVDTDRRPDDYAEDRQTYDQILYDYVYGDGSYERALEDDSISGEQLDEQCEFLWDLLEKKEMHTLADMSGLKEEKDQLLGVTQGYNAEIEAAEREWRYAQDQIDAVDAQIRFQTPYFEMMADAGDITNGEYIPENDRYNNENDEGYTLPVFRTDITTIKPFEATGIDTTIKTDDPHEIYSFINRGKLYQAWNHDNKAAVSSDFNYALMMSNKEIAKFNQYYNNGQYDEAKAFFNGLQPFLRDRWSNYEQINISEIARTYPVSSSASSVVMQVGDGFVAIPRQLAGWLGDENVDDPNSEWYEAVRQANIIQNTIAQDLGPAGGKIYMIGMNTLRNVLNGLMTGGFGEAQEAVGLTMFALQIYQESTYKYLAETRDYNKACGLAFLDSMIETATEKLPFDAMLAGGKIKTGKRWLDGAIVWLMNSASEAGEEFAGGTVGEKIKGLVTGRDSLQKRADEIYAEGGYYDKDGKWIEIDKTNTEQALTIADQQALKEWRDEVIDETVAGFGGGGLGGLYTATQRFTQTVNTGRKVAKSNFEYEYKGNEEERGGPGEIKGREEGKTGAPELPKVSEEILRGGTGRLIELGKGMKEGSTSRQMAEEIEEMAMRGRRPGNYRLGELYHTIAEEVGEQRQQVIRDTVQREVRQQLVDNGMDTDAAEGYAEIISDSIVEGRNLTREEQREMAQDERAIELWREYNSETETGADLRESLAEQLSESTEESEQTARSLQQITQTQQQTARTWDEVETATRSTRSTAQAFDYMVTHHSNLISEEYAQTARELMENDSRAKNSKTFLQDALNIRMAAMTQNETMPRTNSMDAETAQALFKAAQQEFEETDALRIEQNAKVEPGKGKASFDGVEYGTDAWQEKISEFSKQTRNQMGAVAEVARRLGNTVEFINDKNRTMVNGWEMTQDGKIVINVASTEFRNHSMMATLPHELTHWLEHNSREGYAALRKFVLSSLRKQGVNVEQMLLDTIRNQDRVRMMEEQKTGKASSIDTLDVNGAMAELVAKSCENLLTSETMKQELAKENPGLYQQVKKAIKNIVARINNALAGIETSMSTEARLLKNKTEEIAKLWLEARDEALNGTGITEAEAEKALTADMELMNGPETAYGDHASFSVQVTDKEELEFLNNQKTIKTYKSMQLIDGKLYPPMAAVVAGNLEDATTLGNWEKAVEHPELIKGGNKFTLNKGKGKGSLQAAYNPYMHSSNLMINDQFSGAYDRPNLVTVECEVPVSETTSGYHAQYAKDSVGWHSWHTGPVASQLRSITGTEREVFLSRWIKPMRIVSDAEVAQHYAQLLKGTDIAVPDNVVTPSLRDELIKAGVKVTESGRIQYSISETDNKYMEAVKSGNMEDAQKMVDERAEKVFSKSKVRGKDGMLLKMYHGTNAEFDEFVRDKIGSTGRFEGSGFNFTPYEGRASSYGKNVLAGYLNIQKPLSATEKTISVAKLAKLIREADPTGDYIIADYARETRDYGSKTFVVRESMTAARSVWDSSENDVDIYSFISAADSDAESLISKFEELGYDGLIHYDQDGNIKTAVSFNSEQFKRADPVIKEDGEVIPLSKRFNVESKKIQYSIVDSNGKEVKLTEKELTENKQKVADGKIVKTITENKFKKTEGMDFKTKALDYFKENGNVAKSKVFGDVKIELPGIEHMISFLTERRAGMVEAIIPVIENGQIIHIEDRGQRHQFDSAIVAAPIDYMGKTYYMGVVIKQNNTQDNNTYYFHDAIVAEIEKGSAPVNKSLNLQALGADPSIARVLLTIPEYNGKNGNNEQNSINEDSAQFSVEQAPDMDVQRFMDGLNEFHMTSEQERVMLQQWKELKGGMEALRFKIDDRAKKIAALEAKENKSAYDREELRRLNNIMQNDRTRMDRMQREMVRVTGDKGFAKMMYDNARMMNDLVTGRTAEDLQRTVRAMNKELDTVKTEMDERAARLKELAEKEAVLKIRQQFNQRGLKQIAARLKKTMGSTLGSDIIENRLALIALKMKAGEFDMENTQELADMIMGKIRRTYDSYIIDALRGSTLTLSPLQAKELKGQGRSLAEIRQELAGTGIRITDRKGGITLDEKWDELCDLIPSLDRNTTAPDQLDTLMKIISSEKMTTGSFYGSDETALAVSEKILEAARDLIPEIVTDEKSLKLIKETLAFVQEMSGEAKSAADAMADINNLIKNLQKTGEQATSRANLLSGNVQDAIEYFNELSEQSEAAKWQKEKILLREQLKSENTMNILKEQAKWKERIEKDKTARSMMESNLALRRRINTNYTRMRKLLINETDQQNIPEYMKSLARKMVSMITNNDLVNRKISGLSAKDLAETQRVLSIMNMQDGEFSMDDLRMLGDEEAQAMVADALADLEDGIGFYNATPGKDVISNLQAFKNSLTRISDAVTTITNVINAQRQLSFMDRRMDVQDGAEMIRRDLDRSRFKGELKGRGSKALNAVRRAVVYGNTTPVYFFKNLRNRGMDLQWQEVKRGENRNGLEAQKAQAYLQGLAEKTGYKEWCDDKHDVVLGGVKRSISIENMMELYAIWKREQQLNPEMSQHLSKGGVFIQEEEQAGGKLHREQQQQKAIRVTDEEIQAMADQMTAAQKEYMEGMVKYLSTDMSALGNEASMRMYGIKKYKEGYYFPMKVWDGVKSARSDKGISGTDENRAAHKSWSKRRMNMARNALVIGNFTQDAVNHIVEMINYNTMAPAIENLNKVLNWQFTEGQTEEEFTKRNMRVMFQEAYGKESLRYLEQLMQDMNGGPTQDNRTTLRDRLLTVFKKNAVAGSMSVALQQPLSIIRAAMKISPKYLARAISPEYWKGSYQEMMEHSGVAVIKNMGRFDMNFGQSAKDFISPEKKTGFFKKLSDLTTALPQEMDRMTWTRMWSAVKLEQHELHPDMDMKSNEFLDMVAERFNDVMRETQVYDSILVKSSNMRSKNIAAKIVTSFMAEPTLTLNVLSDAVLNVGEKGGKANLAKAGATYVLSAVCQALVKGAMGSGRSPDDKKTWFENFMYRFGNSLISEIDPLNLIPGYSDIMETLKNGELNDDAMGAIGKLKNIADAAGKWISGESEDIFRSVEDTVGQLAQMFTNVPAKNLMRDVRAMINWFTGDKYAQRETSAAVLKYQAEASLFTADNMVGVVNSWLGNAGYKTSNTAYYQRIYQAMKNGNEQEAEDLREYVSLGKGAKDSAIESGIKKAAQEDTSQTEAEKCGWMISNGMITQASYLTGKYKDGELTKKEAEKLLRQLDPEMTDDEVFWEIDRVDYQTETGAEKKPTGQYYRLNDAINNNKAEEIGTAVDMLLEHGVPEKKIRDHLSDWRKEYLAADSAGKVRIRDAITKAYKKIGLSKEDADALFERWNKEKK